MLPKRTDENGKRAFALTSASRVLDCLWFKTVSTNCPTREIVNKIFFFLFRFSSEQTRDVDGRDGGAHKTRALRFGSGGHGTLPLFHVARRPSSSAVGRIQFSANAGSGARAQLPTPVERPRQQQTDGVLMKSRLHPPVRRNTRAHTGTSVKFRRDFIARHRRDMDYGLIPCRLHNVKRTAEVIQRLYATFFFAENQKPT